MQMSEEQREIIEAPIDEQTTVMAAAASGKTFCSTQRLIHVLKQGVDPSKVVLLTFTNNAGAEMARRIPEHLREGLFVGTLHSYANLLLQSHGIETQQYRDEEEFDKLFYLVYENPHVLREIDYLVVDEAQDLNSLQFDFIDFLNPKGSLIVGDVRQSIYGFKDATPRRLLALMRDPMRVTRELTQNYRNSKKILKYSNDIIKLMKGIALAEVKGMVLTQGEIKLISRFDIIPTIETDRDWGKWAVLCRSNAKVHSIRSMLERRGIPSITFRQAQGSLEEMYANMNANEVKVLTIHSSKGLEFDNVIVVDSFNKGQENIRLNYVSVTRAKEKLYLVKK